MPEVFRDEETGESLTMPDNLTSRQQEQIILGFAEALRERAAGTRQARIGSLEAQLGAPLERTEEGRLAEFDQPMARFDLSKSVTARGQAQKLEGMVEGETVLPLDIPTRISRALKKDEVPPLKQKFPDIETRVIDDPQGGQLVAVRLPGQENFTLLDSNEEVTISDFADFAGDLFSMETLASVIATIRTGGASLLTRLGGQAVGAFTGRAADLAIEDARGFEKRSLENMAQDATLSFLLATAGEGVVSLLRGPANMAVGRGGITLTAEEQAAQAFAQRGNVGSLTLGQVVPIFRTIEQQALNTSKRVQNNRLNQIAGALKDMRDLREATDDFTGLSDDVLSQINKRMRDRYISMLNVPPVDPAKAGAAYKAGRKEYVKAAKADLGVKYSAALGASEDVTMDISKGVDLAKKALKGVEMLGADGKPINIRLDPKSELGQLVTTLSKLNPNVAMFDNVTAFEQVKELRSQFFDHKNAIIPGQERINNRIAGEIYSALRESLDNPVGGNDEFVRLYRIASDANAEKEAILEAADMKIIARTTDFDTGDMVRHIARPGNGQSLRMMATVMPEEQFDIIRKQFMADLMSEPENIISRLDAFRRDPRALNVLMTQDQQTTMRFIGSKMRQINSGPFEEGLQNFADIQQRSILIAKKSDATQLTEFIEAAGGKESKGAKAMQAGLMQDIINRSQTTERGVQVIQPAKAIAAITELEQNGKLQAVFTADQIAFLKDSRSLNSFLELTGDPGASIQAAEIGAGAAEILVPVDTAGSAGPIKSFFRSIRAIGRNAIAGWITTNPKARQAFLGMGKRQLDMTTLRATAVIAAEMTADIEEFKE